MGARGWGQGGRGNFWCEGGSAELGVTSEGRSEERESGGCWSVGARVRLRRPRPCLVGVVGGYGTLLASPAHGCGWFFSFPPSLFFNWVFALKSLGALVLFWLCLCVLDCVCWTAGAASLGRQGMSFPRGTLFGYAQTCLMIFILKC
jgi:hypothetical protein